MKWFFNTLEALLASFAARVGLSLLILASLVPPEISPAMGLFFLLVFGSEALCRSALLAKAVKERNATALQCLILGIDILATTSFLPMMLEGGQILRIGRIARLLLLLAYWGPLFRDFFRVALKRERLSQMVLIGGLAALISGIGAGVLRVLDPTGVDFNGDGLPDGPTREIPFLDLLWWTFQQVEDPGNLVQSTHNTSLLLLSLALTASGLLLVAFIIGVGTTLVEDLIKAGRQRNVRLQKHTVILNITDDSEGLLGQVVHYFRKQLRWRKVALLGNTPERPSFLYQRIYRGFRYRHGKLTDLSALKRLDIDQARRVAVLSHRSSHTSDAAVVTATLSTRQLSSSAWIVAELQDPANVKTTLAAGQAHTLPVPANRLATLVLPQALLYPSRALLFEDLVSLSGQEIYTTILGDGLLSDLPERASLPGSLRDFRERVYRDFECLLIGYILEHEGGPCTWLWGLDPVLELNAEPTGPVRGLIGIGERFENLHQATRSLFTPLAAIPAGPPSLELAPLPLPPATELKRLLLLGFHNDMAEALGEILHFFPHCEVTIAAASSAHLAEITDALLTMRGSDGRSFRSMGPQRFELSPAPPKGTGHLLLKEIDRNNDALFEEEGPGIGGVGSVYNYDGLVFLAESSPASERDASTILGVLKLLEGWRHPHTRLQTVVAEICDPAKAALIQPRIAAHPLAPRFTLVQTQELRNQILNHALFAPGLTPVLYNLLTSSPRALETLSLGDRSGPFFFSQLIPAFAALTPPRLPIALLDTEGQILVNPPAHRPLRFEDYTAVHCVTSPD